MLLKPFRVMLMVGVCFFILSGLSGGAEFSADYVIRVKDKGEVAKSRIFIKGTLIRQEMNMRGGKKHITIIRPDKHVIWSIMPEAKMYMEMPYQRDDNKFEPWTPSKEKRAKFIGKETVSGLTCKKFEITENGEKAYFWVSDQSLFPVKTEFKNGSMEYQNIKKGGISNSLFEIPPGYKKMSLPMMPEGLSPPR